MTGFSGKRPFGRTGMDVSPLGFGAAPIGFLATEQARIDEIVGTLADCGVNVIDTAAAYEGSEEALGRSLAGRRDDFVLISKCGLSFVGLPGAEWSAQALTASLDRSLERLRTDRLDVLLLHSCGPDVLESGVAIEALVQARDAGKIRHLGYSGDNGTAAAAARLPEIEVLETSVNICDQANLALVLPVARERQLGVIAKRPLANTAWRSPGEMPGLYQEYARPYHERFVAMGLEAPAGLPWAEIALRFTLHQAGVHTGIVGTTNPENVRRNAEAAAKGPLPRDLENAIREAFAAAERRSGDRWEGLV